MTKFPTLNSLQFVSTTETSGFKSSYNTLFEEQKRGAVQLHTNSEGDKNVFAPDSTIPLQIYDDSDSEEYYCFVTIGSTEIELDVTEAATNYFNVEIPLLSFIQEGTGVEAQISLTWKTGDSEEGYLLQYFKSNLFKILTTEDQNNFLDESTSWAMAYRGETGLWNGYYWGTGYQQLSFDNVVNSTPDLETTEETAESSEGETETLKSTFFEIRNYKFSTIPEWLYRKIVGAAQMPNCYINGEKVKYKGVEITSISQGLYTFTLQVRQSEFVDMYNDTEYTNYIQPFDLTTIFSQEIIDYYGNEPFEEMILETELDLHNEGLTILNGVEYLTALTYLRLSNNSLTDIGDLSNLTSLTYLSLGNNSLTDIGDLSNLTSLTYLFLGNNSLTDIGDLSNLTALIYLYLYNNSLTDIGDLSNLTSLTYLYLQNNEMINQGVDLKLEQMWNAYVASGQIDVIDLSGNEPPLNLHYYNLLITVGVTVTIDTE